MKSSVFSTSIKWASVPVLFAFLLRYGPGYFYGNTRVYDKPIPYEIVDDFFSEKDILERIINAFNTKDANVVYGDLEYVTVENPEKTIRFWKSCNFKYSLREKGWMPPHPTLFVRKEIYSEIGPFDTNFKISADYKSILKIFSIKNLKPIYLPFTIVKMRVGGTSNKSFKNIIRKSYEDFLALRSVKYRFIRAIYALMYKNFSKIKQFF